MVCIPGFRLRLANLGQIWLGQVWIGSIRFDSVSMISHGHISTLCDMRPIRRSLGQAKYRLLLLGLTVPTEEADHSCVLTSNTITQTTEKNSQK